MNRAEKRRQRRLAEKNLHPAPDGGQSARDIRQALELALQHHTAGRLAEAESVYHQILQSDPNQPAALHRLGLIAHQAGNDDLAVDLITKSLAIKPENPGALNNLGIAYQGLWRLEDAVECYRKALAIMPDFAEAHNNLGTALNELGKLDEAAASYREATVFKPDYAEAYSNLGLSLQEMGRLDEAVASFRKAATLDPGLAEAHRHLAGSKKHSEMDGDILAMEQAYARPAISDEQRMHLAFGLGKAFEDLHQYEKAFDFFAEGNAIKRESYSYASEDQANFIKKLGEVFDSSLFAKHQATGCGDATPIFILGMPRSGTTLVEQILASHPQVHGAGELGTLSRIVNSHFGKMSGGEFPETVQRFADADFERPGLEYIETVRKQAPDTRYITDKMPENFNYIGLLKLILPNAKVIHCRRDPADTCLSIFKTYFTGKHEYSNDLGELGRYYKSYRGLMEHWRNVLPGFIHDVQYEDVVTDQVGQTRALLEYCDLEWDDACLAFHKTDRPVTTASAEQVRRPIYKDSVQLWKRYEAQLAPLLENLR